jgi:hypothetical protein
MCCMHVDGWAGEQKGRRSVSSYLTEEALLAEQPADRRPSRQVGEVRLAFRACVLSRVEIFMRSGWRTYPTFYTRHAGKKVKILRRCNNGRASACACESAR